MSSKGPFPGQEFLLRVTSSCLLAHGAGDKPEGTELCSHLCLQGFSKGTLSWAEGRHAVSYCGSARTSWVISGSLGEWPWDFTNSSQVMHWAVLFKAFSFWWVFLLPIFLFEKGGHAVLATDTRHHYCHLLSCSEQYSPTDLLFSGGDSPKEKGQCEKTGPEEGRDEGRRIRSPWGSTFPALRTGLAASQVAHALF